MINPQKKVWNPRAGFMTPKQKWWVTFWATKDSMKGGNTSTTLWQLKSLIRQFEEIADAISQPDGSP